MDLPGESPAKSELFTVRTGNYCPDPAIARKAGTIFGTGLAWMDFF
jgi:hypothetical protein